MVKQYLSIDPGHEIEIPLGIAFVASKNEVLL